MEQLDTHRWKQREPEESHRSEIFSDFLTDIYMYMRQCVVIWRAMTPNTVDHRHDFE